MAITGFHTLTGSKPRVIAHRGSAGTAPENTLVSFEQAVKDGADIIELDVHRTKDNRVVVCHDPSVDKTTSGTGRIAELTLAQIQALDAGFRFTVDDGYTFAFRGQGITIPTLDEVLKDFPNTSLHVEIKATDQVLVELVVALLDGYDRFGDVTILPLIKSRRNALARMVRTRAPFARIGHSGIEVARLFTLSKLHLSGLFMPRGKTVQAPLRRNGFQIVNPEFVRDAHRLGIEVEVWTVDDEDDMSNYLAMGVDAIFTNYPERLRKLLDSGAWLKKPLPR